MAFYVAGFFLWLLVLRWYPLSIAFPLAAGTLIVGSQILGIVLLSERYDALSIVGVSLILLGIAVLAIFDFTRNPS
jgi:multidrug transporter EmrE-like cation transporter